MNTISRYSKSDDFFLSHHPCMTMITIERLQNPNFAYLFPNSAC